MVARAEFREGEHEVASVVTGVLVVVVGGFLIYFLKDTTPALDDLAVRDSDTVAEYGRRVVDTGQDALTGKAGDTLRVAAYLFLGGVAAALQSGVLKFFKTFHYDQIGIRCQLRDEVCLMSGIEPARDGYWSRGSGDVPSGER